MEKSKHEQMVQLWVNHNYEEGMSFRDLVKKTGLDRSMVENAFFEVDPYLSPVKRKDAIRKQLVLMYYKEGMTIEELLHITCLTHYEADKVLKSLNIDIKKGPRKQRVKDPLTIQCMELYKQELTLQEIADALDIPLQKVKNRIYKNLKKVA